MVDYAPEAALSLGMIGIVGMFVGMAIDEFERYTLFGYAVHRVSLLIGVLGLVIGFPYAIFLLWAT